MGLQELLFHRFRTIGFPGRLLVATCVAAVFNFGETVFQMATTAGTRTIGDFTIVACRVGPAPFFYPRFFIACSLLIAALGVFRRSFPRSVITIVGSCGALTVYVYWWMDSYRLFRTLANADIWFIHSPETKQTAYLYGGTWLDAGIAASVIVCSVLLFDRFVNSHRNSAADG